MEACVPLGQRSAFTAGRVGLMSASIPPNLTDHPFELWELLGRQVRVETSAEIVAKKLWHRDDRATARDLLDLALVIEREPEVLAKASVFLTLHRVEFLKQVEQRKVVLKAQFEAIETLAYQPSYEQAAVSVSYG